MADVRETMPFPSSVDPLFDGHPERTLLELDIHEQLDWIWEAMVLLRMGRGLLPPTTVSTPTRWPPKR